MLSGIAALIGRFHALFCLELLIDGFIHGFEIAGVNIYVYYFIVEKLILRFSRSGTHDSNPDFCLKCCFIFHSTSAQCF